MIKKKIFLFTSITVIGLMLLQPKILNLLSVTKKVDGNILLIEGWMPKSYIDQAYKEFTENNYDYIITTGLNVSEYYMIPMNGYFIFYIDKIFSDLDIFGFNEIAVSAHSELSGEHCSHFNLYVNDSIIGDFCAGRSRDIYKTIWQGKLSDVDSIMINFDDDAMGDFGDHNLYVKELIINDTLTIPYQNNTVYKRIARGWKKRIPINYTTHAGKARNYLIELGMDSSKIITIPGHQIKKNRTLSSALCVEQWLMSYNDSISGINIISVGPHALRTRMTYKKLINNLDIGIIAIPIDKDDVNYRKFENTINFIKEIVALPYYWILLRFY